MPEYRKMNCITLRVANVSTSEYWSVATFDEAVRAELTGLADGSPLSCSGPFHAEKYQFKGETRVRLKITADAVLVLKPRARAPRPGHNKPRRGGPQRARRGPVVLGAHGRRVA